MDEIEGHPVVSPQVLYLQLNTTEQIAEDIKKEIQYETKKLEFMTGLDLNGTGQLEDLNERLQNSCEIINGLKLRIEKAKDHLNQGCDRCDQIFHENSLTPKIFVEEEESVASSTQSIKYLYVKLSALCVRKNDLLKAENQWRPGLKEDEPMTVNEGKTLLKIIRLRKELELEIDVTRIILDKKHKMLHKLTQVILNN